MLLIPSAKPSPPSPRRKDRNRRAPRHPRQSPASKLTTELDGKSPWESKTMPPGPSVPTRQEPKPQDDLLSGGQASMTGRDGLPLRPGAYIGPQGRRTATTSVPGVRKGGRGGQRGILLGSKGQKISHQKRRSSLPNGLRSSLPSFEKSCRKHNRRARKEGPGYRGQKEKSIPHGGHGGQKTQ